MFISMGRSSYGARLSRDGIYNTLHPRFKKAGIDTEKGRKSLHALRGTFITKLALAGIPPITLRTMARHQDINTTLLYVADVDRFKNPAEFQVSYTNS